MKTWQVKPGDTTKLVCEEKLMDLDNHFQEEVS